MVASAATVTWTGTTGDQNYITGGNWSGGAAPANNDYADTAVFNGGTATTVNIPAGRLVAGITFQSVGWTMSGGSFSEITTLSSSGNGTNTIASPLTAHGNATWTVGAGNILSLSGSFYQRNKNLSLTGGGELKFSTAIGGFSGTVGSWGFTVTNGQLTINAAGPYQSSTAGAVFINGPTAKLKLQNTISGVTSQITAGRIVDSLGNGLAIDDLGGGYVLVSPAPVLPFTWTGSAGDGLFVTGANWSEGVAPANNDYSHTAHFNGGTPRIITVPSGRSIKALDFASPGWTLSGGSFSEITTIDSSAAGTNTIATPLTAHAHATWTIDTGSILSLTGSFYQRDKKITLNGGGELAINASIGGYGGTVGAWGIYIVNGKVRFNSANPYLGSSAGAVFMNGSNSVLRLQNSVAGAQSLVNAGRIVDGLGGGLVISDVGGGTVEVVPGSSQPSTPPIAGNWTLQFQDQFDGTVLDSTKWRLGSHWAGMAGTAGIAPENVTLSGGKLRIKSEQRTITYGGASKSYASGEVTSFLKYRQKYGYFEARMKYPAVTGLWPAFWMMPDRGDYGWQDGYFRSFVKFNLTGVNPGAISTAELKMKVSAVESGGDNNVLFMKVNNDSWSESMLTWNNKPVEDPVWIAQRWNQAVAGQDMTVNVKDYVTQQMAGDKVISFAVADTFMKTKYVKFHSSEAVNQADRPRLVINGTTYYATEDSYVRWGGLADDNYGSNPELIVEESWADTATTFNGGMEFDIMESLGIWGPNRTAHAMHWDGYGAQHQVAGSSGSIAFPATSDGFHIYGMYWEPGKVEFYVDGVKTYEWANARVMSTTAYMLLSLQTGGWDGNNPGPQVNNQVLEVDWVRAWSGTKTP